MVYGMFIHSGIRMDTYHMLISYVIAGSHHTQYNTYMPICQVPSSQKILFNMFRIYTSQFREERYLLYSSWLMQMLTPSITRMNWQSSPVSKERACSPLDLPVFTVNATSPTVWTILTHRGMMPHPERAFESYHCSNDGFKVLDDFMGARSVVPAARPLKR